MMDTSYAIAYGVLLLTLVYLTSTMGQQWSGFVNQEEEAFSFTCPEDLALSGIASEFFV